MRRIVITGGTGYLGSQLVHLCLSKNFEVIVIARPASSTRRLSPYIGCSNFTIIDPGSFDVNIAKDTFALIHAATAYGRKNESAQEMIDANYIFPISLIDKMKSGNGTFINVDTFAPKYSNIYSLSKFQFNEMAKINAFDNGVPYTNVKLHQFYGQGEEETQFISWLFKNCRLGNELLLTTGEQLRDFVSVKDVLVAFEIILSNLNPQEGTFEEFQIGSGYPVKVKTVVETVHRLTRSTSKLNFGARPHASTDFEFEKAVTTKLLNLGWYASVKLEDGLASYLD